MRFSVKDKILYMYLLRNMDFLSVLWNDCFNPGKQKKNCIYELRKFALTIFGMHRGKKSQNKNASLSQSLFKQLV